WWRGASSGPRSRAVAAGAATAAFLVWIAVPSGGGLMPSFPAGLPTSATIQQANATAPPPGQGSQLPSSASDLAMPSVLSPGAAGTLPGGGSAARAGAGASPVPRQWLYLNAPIGASGAPNSRWGLPLSAEMAGRSPTVLVGLVQGSPVSPALAGAVGDLVRRGALVELLLVPEPTAAGGAPAFASWLTQALAALEPVPLVQLA